MRRSVWQLQSCLMQASLVLLALWPSFAGARQGPPRIPDADRIRLAEAYRIGERLGEAPRIRILTGQRRRSE